MRRVRRLRWGSLANCGAIGAAALGLFVSVCGGCGKDSDSPITGDPGEVEGVAGSSAEPPPAEVPPDAAPLAGSLARTPPMGFNNWNAFGCDVNETLIKQTADFFVSSGLKDAGYEFVNIDDCWSSMQRDAEGKLVPDSTKFPSGIKGVADYVHGLGLKLGLYGDAGTRTCAGYPGSLGNEEVDAQTFADWGIDYLKYDNCYNESDGSREDFVRRYTAMRDALGKVDRPIVYSICEWGQSQPWEWATGVGQLWRTTGDITDSWSSIRDIIAFNAPLAEYAGPGHWNDPDMLEIGNRALTAVEKRTHMSMWSMMAAPLIIGTDLRIATEETLSILNNRDIIAIDQDMLGRQGTIVSNTSGLMVMVKPLASGEYAVALYNATDAQALISAAATAVGLPAADGYYLHDVWGASAAETRNVIAAGVPAHGTVVYRTRPLAVDDAVPPAVTLEGTLGTLIPGVPEAVTLTTRATNRGVGAANQLAISVQAPAGWTVTASSPSNSDTLATDASLETTWAVVVQAGTAAGRYPLTLTATYAHAEAGTTTISSELVGSVAVAPPDGSTHLSTLLAVSSTNGSGPVELDKSNGGATEGDGNLLTIGGRVYTRGFGTQAPSSLTYYLGGRCSQLTVDVGIDDEITAGGGATFGIYADGTLVTESAVLTAADPASPLVADVTGATSLELRTDPAGAPDGDRTDWALPRIVCGGSAAPTTLEQTLFSFETGIEEFVISNAAAGGSVAPSALFATDGIAGLTITSPVDGNWFGRRFAAPVDLSAFSTLRYDVKTAAIGTPGEFAIEVGAAASWCQGGLWTWTNAGASKTITRRFDEISCPAGVTRDLTQVRGIWVYLKDGTFTIDNIRAE